MAWSGFDSSVLWVVFIVMFALGFSSLLLRQDQLMIASTKDIL